MSTNIRVDVTLQRLQNQSRQATEQNRAEREQREEATVYTVNQPSKREEILVETRPNTRTIVTQTVSGQDFADVKFVPEGSTKRDSPFATRRPAAQRGEETAINGYEILYDYYPGQYDTNNLTIGNIGLEQKAEYTFQDWPITSPNYDLQLPEDGGVLATIGYRDGDAPLAGVYTSHTSFVTNKYYDLSIPICLPVDQTTSIIAFDYHYVHHTIVSSLTYVNTNESVVKYVDNSGINVYNRIDEYVGTFTFNNDDFQVVRETLCFLVKPEGVRQLTPPNEFLDALYDRRPLASKTGQTLIYATSDFQITQDYRNGLIQNIVTRPSAYTYQSVPGFEEALWRPQYTGPGFALAKQFGFGSFCAQPHGYLGWNYWSAGVYAWLTQALDLSSYDSQDYANLSSQFTRQPPRFISDDTGVSLSGAGYNDSYRHFGVAKTRPVDYWQAMEEEQIKWSPRYGIDTKLRPTEDLMFSWNWDSAQYCRRELLRLGFTREDLAL